GVGDAVHAVHDAGAVAGDRVQDLVQLFLVGCLVAGGQAAPGGFDVLAGVADPLARGADVVGQVGDHFGVDLGFGEGEREDLVAVGGVDEQCGLFVGGQVGGGGGVQAGGRGWLGGHRGGALPGSPHVFPWGRSVM